MSKIILNSDRYDVISLLGKGGMGSVYRAQDKELNRIVALKCIENNLTEGGIREATLREARTLAKLNHPHILKIYDVFEQDSQIWIVSEWIEGKCLQEMGGVFPLPIAVAIALRVAEAVAYTHTQGILHRDLKPQNIMLDQTSGRVVIIDYGVAFSPGSSGKTLVGTFRYLDPSVLAGEAASSNSDLYSMGLVFAELLTGEVVLPDLSPLPLYQYIDKELKNRIELICDGLYPPLAELITNLLFQSADENFSSQYAVKKLREIFFEWYKDSPEDVISKYLSNFKEETFSEIKEKIELQINHALENDSLNIKLKGLWLSFSDRFNKNKIFETKVLKNSPDSEKDLLSDFTSIRTTSLKSKNRQHYRTYFALIALLILVLFAAAYYIDLGADGPDNNINEVAQATVNPVGKVVSTLPTGLITPTEVTVSAEAVAPPVHKVTTPKTEKVAEPIHDYCSVRISANVWADVSLNEKYLGRIPRAEPFKIKPGSYKIKLSSPFIKTIEKSLIVPDSREKGFSFNLELLSTTK
ncbi:MAG: serine/threonine protein kinase [Oligoflexales bacterium]|nr:serine/threonine protein kinase [Oligoflexales bacterium]